MVFTTAEIEILRLAGWLKGVPLELRRMDGGLFSPAGIESLCLYKLLYVTKNGLYLKLTPAGWSLLEVLCYHYPKDACYITDPQKLTRRNEAAKAMFTCYRAGIDIFADTPDRIADTSIYLSAIAARRNLEFTGSKVWAGCRMAGILRLLDTAYLLHFMDGQGLLFQNELNLFHKLTSGRCEHTAGIYAADSYVAAAEGLLFEPDAPQDKRRPNGWRSFREAGKSMTLPLHLLECSETGALQLMLMNLPDYRKTIAQLALCEDYRPPQEPFADFDAVSHSLGLPLLVGINLDVKRLGRACRAVRANRTKLMVVTLEAQTDAYKLLLTTARVQDSVDLVFLPDALFFEALGRRLYHPPMQPYQTTKGGYLDASDFTVHCKAGGQGKPPA